MLNILYGRAATGKSYKILENIKNDVLNNKEVILLVPEQFTFESERALLKMLGNKSSTNVSVLSFSRLYDEISRKTGGRIANRITESDKTILINRAFKSVVDKLKIWNKYSSSAGFCQNLLVAINELKSEAISPEEILNTSDTINNSYLKLKLNDISIIYSAYNALLGNTFLDPSDDLTRLNTKLQEFKFFKNKNVYIDSFKNFTGQQYKIIEHIISQANNVCVSLTTNNISSTDFSLFYNVNLTAQKIISISKKYGVKVDKPKKLENNFYKNTDLSVIESHLSGESREYNKSFNNMFITKCENIADEAAFAAATIRKLVRTQNYRYKDFVIIARNAEDYKNSIEKECIKNNVFCFFDNRTGITNLPVVALINSALMLAKNLSTEEILNFHKTGLTDLSFEEISELENYTYLWNVKGSTWFDEWTMNPNGFVAGDSKNYIEKLNNINGLRQKAIEPIFSFKNSLNGTPKNIATAILKLLENCNTTQKLKDNYNYLKQNNLINEAEILRQGYDTVIEILDSIVKCMPDSNISISEFIDIWNNALNNVTIGNIPQMLDEVTFGSADRIKPSRPKIAFVLGVNQGVFPANTVSFGIFSNNERKVLIENGLEISEFDVTAAINEDYLLYSSLCCATEKLYICFSANNNDGALLEPAQAINDIINTYDIKVDNFVNNKLTEFNLPETKTKSLEKLYKFYSNNKNDYLTIKKALNNNGLMVNVENKLDNFYKYDTNISPENAKKLFGQNIRVSATSFDTYHRCKFSYFCRYGLRIKKIQPADFDVLQRGTLVHFVLENLISRFFNDFKDFTKQDSDNKVDELISEYLSLIDGYEKIVTKRIEFLINVIAGSLKDVAFHIINELLQSDFTPKYCELKIGDESGIPAINIPFENGNVTLNGSIDRLDLWNGYVRIVDYKTGTKNFKLPDILLGLNMQMLIYLYAVVRGGDSALNKNLPAGILYMPSKRDFGEDKVLSMNGLVLLDEAVISAMDKQGEGEYIPRKPFKADGSLKKQTASFAEANLFNEIFNYIELLFKRFGNNVSFGEFNVQPTDGVDFDACKYCDYSAICCNENKEHISADKTLSNADIMDFLKEANKNGI